MSAVAILANREPETLAQRIRRLQGEARQLARQHIGDFTATLADLSAAAAEIAAGGDAYPPGVRELARRLAEDFEVKAQMLEALAGRRP